VIPRIKARSSHERRHPFARAVQGDEWRPLCFVVDLVGLPSNDASAALFGLAGDGHVDLMGTELPDEVVDGSLLELPAVPDPYEPRSMMDSLPIYFGRADDLSRGVFGVLGMRLPLERAAEHAARAQIRLEDAQRAVLLIAAGSQAPECDGLVSENPLVDELKMDTNTVFTFAEAVALIGLQLRIGNQFTLGYGRLSIGRGFFYWVLARELLPAGWRCCGACMQSAGQTGDALLEGVALMPIARLDRALRARDGFHDYMKRPHEDGAMDEAVFFFETALMYLSAAFDATARIAHLVYQIAGSDRISWRSKSWRRLIRAQHKDLADFMAEGNAGGAALAAVQTLRNTIHGEGLRTVSQSHGPSLVNVPPAEVPDLKNALEVLGGLGRWGVEEKPWGVFVESQLYLEVAFEEAIRALNRILELVQIERLPELDAGALRDGPSIENEGLFGYGPRTRVLAGLS
jgi:hypothetical protein